MISDRSRQNLNGVHPDLVRVIERADEMGARFTVVCGLRKLEQQRELVAQGKSRTMKSRHLTGHAVDLVDERFTWGEREMADLAFIVKAAAADCKVPIEWGGDWKSFIDTPHFQLPEKQYPADQTYDDGSAREAKLAITPPAPNPLHKSGTIWGSVGTAVAGVSVYIEQTFQTLLDTAAKWADFAPIRAMFGDIKLDGKAMSFGLLAGCVTLVISRRVKASQEGKSG